METTALEQVKTYQADLDDRLTRVQKRLDSVEAMGQLPMGESGMLGESKALATQLWECDEYKTWIDRGFKGRLTLKLAMIPLEQKTTITSTAVGASTPGILVPQRVPGIVSPGVRKFRIRDLLPQFPTQNNAVEFVKENVYTNAASPQSSEGGDKAESALTFTIDYEPVRTIAHWIPVSKQVFSDFVELQAYLNQRLMQGLLDQDDLQLLFGDGVGQHMTGFSMEANAFDTSRNVTGDTKLDRLNHAISQIEDVNLQASGMVLHPRDWRAIQLQKTEQGGPNTGQYIMGGPIGTFENTLWGLPVATSTAMTPGKFFVGAFQTHTALWVRQEIIIDISESHASFFTQNLLAVRCEMREALTIYRSDALIYGAFY